MHIGRGMIMCRQDYDLGYYEGVRNILQMVLKMNNNTAALLEAIKEELIDAEKCMDETKRKEDEEMALDELDQNPYDMG